MTAPRRLFTLQEATDLLPSARDLLVEIQGKRRDLVRLSAELEGLIDRTEGNGHAAGARLAAGQADAERTGTELDALFARLLSLGCELKGIDEGLIDFPSLREGRVVYLCWKLGEERIGFWHELDAGFAGRQPL